MSEAVDDMLKGMQQGKVEDTFGWCYEVTAAPKGFAQEGVNGDVQGKGMNGKAVDELP